MRIYPTAICIPEMTLRRTETSIFHWLAYIFLVAVAGWIGWELFGTSGPIPIHPETMCPTRAGVESVSAVNLILIDRTDPITEIEASDIRKHLNSFARQSVVSEKIAVYEIGQAANLSATPRIVLCNPGGARSDTIEDKMSRNPVSERLFQEKFLNGLDRILREMLVIAPQADSPIMELVQAAVVENLKHGTSNIPRRLIIVSDLMQHSREYSHYQGLGEQAFFDGAFFKKVATDLAGIDVRILYIKRLQGRNKQPEHHVQFWKKYFERLGARSFVEIPIEGAAWAK